MPHKRPPPSPPPTETYRSDPVEDALWVFTLTCYSGGLGFLLGVVGHFIVTGSYP